jgi:hypothetical protein
VIFPSLRFLFVLYFCCGSLATVKCVAAVASVASREQRLEEAYHDLTQYRFNRAETAFADLMADPGWPLHRDAVFGRALALLNTQPQTQDKLRLAEALFAEVRAVSATDDLGIGARYFGARLHQVHFQPSDVTRAREELLALGDDHPGHYLGQLAWVRLAFIDLFAPGEKEAKRAVLARYEALSLPWVDEHLSAVFHTVLGDAIMVIFGDAARATRHYGKVVQNPEVRELTLVDALVRIGETAHQAGVADVAADAYRQVLALSPRDPRAWFIRNRLAGLEGKTP